MDSANPHLANSCPFCVLFSPDNVSLQTIGLGTYKKTNGFDVEKDGMIHAFNSFLRSLRLLKEFVHSRLV